MLGKVQPKYLFFTLLTLLSMGCGGNGGGGRNDEPSPQQVAKKVIGPAGGEIDLGTVGKVLFPPGALTASTEIEVSSYAGQDYPYPVLLDNSQPTLHLRFDIKNYSTDGIITVQLNHTPLHQDAFGVVTSWDGAFLTLPRMSPLSSPAKFQLDQEALSFFADQGIVKANLVLFDYIESLEGASRTLQTSRAPSFGIDWPNSFLDRPNWDVMLRLTPRKGAPELANHNWKDDEMWSSFDADRSQLNPNGRIAIVIHGMSNDIKAVTNLAYYLYSVRGAGGQNIYNDVLGFEYTWTEAIDDNGDHLAQIVDEIKSRFPNATIDLFGHSMGGLVARWAIEHGDRKATDTPTGLGSDVERLFTFSTPHVGVPYSALEPQMVFLRSRFHLTTVPQGIADLRRGGSFMGKLNSSPRASSRSAKYIAFGGSNADYLGKVGLANTNYYSRQGGLDLPHDGIVSQYSAQNEILDGRAIEIVRPDPLFNLNHSLVVGKYVQADSGFDLNTVYNQLYFSSLATHVKLSDSGGWKYFAVTGNWYKAIQAPLGISWADAKVAAENVGGMLVCIGSAAENEFVRTLVDSPEFWITVQEWQVGPHIGLFQQPGSPEPSGGWRWVDGSPLTYSSWLGGEPNNQAGTENIASFRSSVSFREPLWNDGNDWVKHRSYVVERTSPP